MKTINTKPGAWICTNDNERQNRGRSKVYQPGSKIYLNDNEEFEIELFNPTTYNVKAEISIDGKNISSGGLIIKSGQRVYLECFPDSQRKFTFKTYEVENSNESLEAIRFNGKVVVNFYREKTHHYNNTFSGNIYPGTGVNTNYYDGTTTCANTNYYDGTSNIFFSNNSLSISNNIETGQTEGGNISDQKFESVYMDFQSWVISSYTFQLLPMSQKPIDVKDYKSSEKKKNVYDKIEQLEKIQMLKNSGTITRDEFNDLKLEIMNK